MGVAGGILSGDYKILRPSVEYRHFVPDRWISHRRNTLGFRLLGQYIRSYGGSTIPFYERFFVGGETTLRGFDLRSISPIAISSTYKNDLFNNTSIDPVTGLLKIDKSIISIGGDSLGHGQCGVPDADCRSAVDVAVRDVGVNRVSHVKGIGKFGDNDGRSRRRDQHRAAQFDGDRISVRASDGERAVPPDLRGEPEQVGRRHRARHERTACARTEPRHQVHNRPHILSHGFTRIRVESV